MALHFEDIVDTEEKVRAIIGDASELVRRKQIDYLDVHACAFIAKSPFLLISSTDSEGRMDISPKGDPPGFVRVLDQRTLAIPDRPGNRRVDTFKNLVQTPQVGLIFLIPGKKETLRLSGQAQIVRDPWVREPMEMNGKVPDFAIIVRVKEVFFHCAKCVIRSKLWEPDSWPDLAGLPTLAQTMVDHGKLEKSVDEMQSIIEGDAQNRLY